MENPILISSLRKIKDVQDKDKSRFTHLYSEVIGRLYEMKDLMNQDDYERIAEYYHLDNLAY